MSNHNHKYITLSSLGEQFDYCEGCGEIKFDRKVSFAVKLLVENSPYGIDIDGTPRKSPYCPNAQIELVEIMNKHDRNYNLTGKKKFNFKSFLNKISSRLRG